MSSSRSIVAIIIGIIILLTLLSLFRTRQEQEVVSDDVNPVPEAEQVSAPGAVAPPAAAGQAVPAGASPEGEVLHPEGSTIPETTVTDPRGLPPPTSSRDFLGSSNALDHVIESGGQTSIGPGGAPGDSMHPSLAVGDIADPGPAQQYPGPGEGGPIVIGDQMGPGASPVNQAAPDGSAPEASSPGIQFEAPEAGDTGMPGPPPEASDPGGPN